jgi:hypothetical protein
MSEPTPSTVELQYEPGAPIRRRRVVRRILLGLALVAMILLVWLVGPPLWQKWRVRSIINQARAFAFPEESVIYEKHPDSTRASLVRQDPPLLAQLAQITERGPGAFALFGTTAAPESPLAFLHERTSEKGVTRLIALRIAGVTYTRADGGSLTIHYKAMPLELRDKLPPVAHGIGESSGPDLSLLPPSALLLPDGPATPGPIRIFAAYPVPNNPAAFILPYEIGGQRKTIFFSLVDDALGRGAFVITVNQPRPKPRRPTTTPSP